MITTITLSSYNEYKKRFGNNPRVFHQFLPYDLNFLVEHFLDSWRPNIVSFVDSEIWPNFIFSIKEKFDCGVIKHSFTHFDLDSKVILLKVDDNQIKLKDNCIFIKPENLDIFSIPTLYHKIIKLVLKNI